MAARPRFPARLRLRLRARDWPIAALALAALLSVLGAIRTGLGLSGAAAGGSRRVDAEALQARLRTGDLVRHPAEWWHAAGDEPVPGK